MYSTYFLRPQYLLPDSYSAIFSGTKTSSRALPRAPPAVAITVVVPAETPVAMPLTSIVATCGSATVQVTEPDIGVPDSSRTVAEKPSDAPAPTINASPGSTVMMTVRISVPLWPPQVNRTPSARALRSARTLRLDCLLFTGQEHHRWSPDFPVRGIRTQEPPRARQGPLLHRTHLCPCAPLGRARDAPDPSPKPTSGKTPRPPSRPAGSTDPDSQGAEGGEGHRVLGQRTHRTAFSGADGSRCETALPSRKTPCHIRRLAFLPNSSEPRIGCPGQSNVSNVDGPWKHI